MYRKSWPGNTWGGARLIRRFFQSVLVVTFLVGLVFAWRSGRERWTLTRELIRIDQTVGELTLTDPTKVHIRAIETGEPLHFAWRVYLPANYRQHIRHKGGSYGSSWSSNPAEFIARVRFKEESDGRLQVYTRFSGGSSLMSCGRAELGSFLRGRHDQLEVEQIGQGKTEVIEPDGSALLLRIKMPDELAKKAREKLPDYEAKEFVPVIYEIHLGSDSRS